MRSPTRHVLVPFWHFRRARAILSRHQEPGRLAWIEGAGWLARTFSIEGEHLLVSRAIFDIHQETGGVES